MSNSSKAKLIIQKVIEFLVLENQSHFRCLMEHLEPRYMLLSWRFFSETAVPNIYRQVWEFISNCLKNYAMLSFTKDIWSSDICHMFLASLIPQWIDSDFTLQKVAYIQERPVVDCISSFRKVEYYCISIMYYLDNLVNNLVDLARKKKYRIGIGIGIYPWFWYRSQHQIQKKAVSGNPYFIPSL